jgi:malic enzyme
MVDSKGLITEDRGDDLPSHKRLFARPAGDGNLSGLRDLQDIIATVKPHALIGLSAAGPSWNRETIEEMCEHCDRPLVFPLSNPTDKAEITAEDALHWSQGKCVFAAGSPFDPVEYQGRTIVPGQANNVFIFPGVGFGAVMGKSSEVTDGMFTAAAKALSGCVSEERLNEGRLYPPMSELRQVAERVAAAVAAKSWEEGVSKLEEEPRDWLVYVRKAMWDPSESKTTRVSGMPHGQRF